MSSEQFDPRQPYRYVRYGRMSSDMQNPRSPDQQFDSIGSELSRLGYPWVHVGDYRDDHVSGRLVEKLPGLQRMLEEIRSGLLTIDLILVDTFDRFGRDPRLGTIRQELADNYGVLLLTADSRFADPTTACGQFMATFDGIRAVEDNRIRARHVRRGKRDAFARKQWGGGRPPVGYRLRSVVTEHEGRVELRYNVLEPDPETRHFVSWIFRLAVETEWGYHRLAGAWNRNPEIPDRLKGRSATTMRHMLCNAIYMGELRYGRNSLTIRNDLYRKRANPESDWLIVPDYCEPLVDRAVWEHLQVLLGRRSVAGKASTRASAKLLKPVTPPRALKYPLSGLVR